MRVTRDAANEQLRDWVADPALRAHCESVAFVMERAADRYGGGEADHERWYVTGVLHDADYERWPDEHPTRIVAWLEGRGEPEIAHAISAHHSKWGVPAESSLDRALLACDELSGFILAYARVRPGGLETMEPRGVLKKLKDRSFASGVDREEVRVGATLLDVPLAEHVSFTIDALRTMSEPEKRVAVG